MAADEPALIMIMQSVDYQEKPVAQAVCVCVYVLVVGGGGIFFPSSFKTPLSSHS